MQNNDYKKYKTFLKDHYGSLEDIDTSLSNFFSNYKNKEKIIKLLSIFILNYNIIFKCYGIDGLTQFSNEKWRDALRFGYYKENKINLKLPKERYNSFWRFAQKYLNHYLLPGGSIKSIKDKIFFRISKFSVLGIRPKINNERKDMLLKILIKYFSKYYKQEDLILVKKLISEDIPEMFYAEPIITKKKLIKINCVSNIFFEFIGYENIFLYQSKIIVTGNQHGGGYFSYKNVLFHDLEHSICDEYIGWGFSKEINNHQERYNKIISNKQNDKRIIWHESAGTILPKFYLFFDLFKQVSKEKIEFIHNELKNKNIEFYSQPHPLLKNSLYDNCRGRILADPKKKGENLLNKSDLIICDYAASSLLHFCVENNILFIIISHKEELNFMTENQIKWYQVLREAGQWIFTNERERLGKIAQMYLSDELILSEKVTSFHESTFINI